MICTNENAQYVEIKIYDDNEVRNVKLVEHIKVHILTNSGSSDIEFVPSKGVVAMYCLFSIIKIESARGVLVCRARYSQENDIPK